MNEREFKKKIRLGDLAVQSGRKRQSPRTGFVHYLPQDETASDVIGIYENFCFALALFRQKTSESVLEAKEIVERLLHFQTPSGNFPLYVHDFPKCWDSLLPLKIAPVLTYLLREFSSVLGLFLKEKVEKALYSSLSNIEKLRLEKSLPPLWEIRYQVLKGGECPLDFSPRDAAEWFEWIVSKQLLSQNIGPLPYDSSLQFLNTDGRVQEKGEPRPSIVEWFLAEPDGYSPRLLRDHPHQLYAALFSSFSETIPPSNTPFIERESKDGFQLLWQGNKLHSFILPKGKTISIPLETEAAKGDLFEVESFADLQCSISIGTQKGTVFQLGEWLEIEADGVKISLRFHLIDGVGEFCGHISKGNRPSQIACKGPLSYEVYDWRIVLRTLRKSTPCKIYTEVVVAASSLLRCSDELSIAIPMA